jgi:leucyl aminopeptidase
MKIEYKCNISENINISFSLKAESLKSDYVINNEPDELINSMHNLIKELEAYLENNKDEKYIIAISKGIIDSDDLKHILWKIIKIFVPWKYKYIIITHIGKHNKNVASIINTSSRIHHARMLAMLPSNMGYPSAMATHFKKIFKNLATKVSVFSRDKLKRMGMNLLLSVGDSSRNKHKPLMIVIEYKPNHKNKDTICLIGKGITFDSGGIDIKS